MKFMTKKHCHLYPSKLRQGGKKMGHINEAMHVEYEKKEMNAACIRLLSQKAVLAQILKTCVLEFQDADVTQIAKACIQDVVCQESLFKNTKSCKEGIEQDESLLFNDIRFMANIPKEKGTLEVTINMEAKEIASLEYPMIKRSLTSGCAMVSNQSLPEYADDHEMNKVYSIWILLHPTKRRENTMTYYEIKERNVVGHVKEAKQHYDLINVVMIALAKDYKKTKGILRLLGILLSNELQASKKEEILAKEFSLHMNEQMKEANAIMCNYADSIMEIGREEGRKECTNDIAKHMLQMKYTSEEIMKVCGLTMDEVKELQIG